MNSLLPASCFDTGACCFVVFLRACAANFPRVFLLCMLRHLAWASTHLVKLKDFEEFQSYHQSLVLVHRIWEECAGEREKKEEETGRMKKARCQSRIIQGEMAPGLREIKAAFNRITLGTIWTRSCLMSPSHLSCM